MQSSRVTRLFYQQLSKKDTSWLINTKLQAKSLQGLLLLFLEDKTDFDNKVENFYNPTFKKVNMTIDGNPHGIFKESILPKNIYPEICKKCYQNNSDVSFEEYLTTKYGLWIDTRSLTKKKLLVIGRVLNRSVKLQLDKVGESKGYLLCYIFAVQHAYAHFHEGKLKSVDM